MGGETKPGTPEASREKFKMRVLRALSRLAGEVGERPVGFGHAVRVFTLFDRRAAIVDSIHQLTGQPVDHGVLTARARRLALARGASPSCRGAAWSYGGEPRAFR